MDENFKLMRLMLDGYMGSRSEDGKKMYSRYLSFINPYLFEEMKGKQTWEKRKEKRQIET